MDGFVVPVLREGFILSGGEAEQGGSLSRQSASGCRKNK